MLFRSCLSQGAPSTPRRTLCSQLGLSKAAKGPLTPEHAESPQVAWCRNVSPLGEPEPLRAQPQGYTRSCPPQSWVGPAAPQTGHGAPHCVHSQPLISEPMAQLLLPSPPRRLSPGSTSASVALLGTPPLAEGVFGCLGDQACSSQVLLAQNHPSGRPRSWPGCRWEGVGSPPESQDPLLAAHLGSPEKRVCPTPGGLPPSLLGLHVFLPPLRALPGSKCGPAWACLLRSPSRASACLHLGRKLMAG